ncbi:uncharacterized protein F5Z01DRAFT_639591 [Emericellopsis atlantica]|uniref:F-box domain-containing protein n=1 Tax=Emericellopsis atlantica TaxID=2614577 RepID=A0A9P8CMZ0_9HYPO|nr:uncharacterized protein F5Z01DRAFT_639591 [Emericellopsis atlantica]KAG9251191.1 hypothetical protein F5Z01DRAFT_639591 [Emericellopsis atlantica]
MALYSIMVDAQPKNYLSRMPEEIKRLIADHLPNGDLLRLARVSHIMQHQALFVLYFRDATQGTSEAIKFAVVRSCLAPAGKKKKAVTKSCRNIFERSLRLGANVNTIHVRGSSRATALAVAAAFKNGLFWVRRLLAAGADRTIVSKNLLAMPGLEGLRGKWKEQCRKIDSPRMVDKVLRGQTEWLPLCVPAVMRYDEICNVLCEDEKSSPYLTVPYDAVDTHRLTILHTYAWKLDTDTPGQCLRLFEKYPNNWNDLIPLAGYNALHLAIASGNMILFDKLLDASNAIIDSQEWTSSPIIWVIEECAETSKHHEPKAITQRRQSLKHMLQRLLDAGASAQTGKYYGKPMSPLIFAIINKGSYWTHHRQFWIQIMDLLLGAGPDLNALHECDTLLRTSFPATCTPLMALLIALTKAKSGSREDGLWPMFHKMVNEHGADVNVCHSSQGSLMSLVFHHILESQEKDLLSESDAKSMLRHMKKVGARLRSIEAPNLLEHWLDNPTLRQGYDIQQEAVYMPANTIGPCASRLLLQGNEDEFIFFVRTFRPRSWTGRLLDQVLDPEFFTKKSFRVVMEAGAKGCLNNRSRLDIYYGATEAIADIQKLHCLGAKVGSEPSGVSAIDEFYCCADKFKTAETRTGAVMDKVKLKLFELEREERRMSRNGSRQ